MPPSRSHERPRDSSYQDWLRALEKAMRGEHAGTSAPHDPAPRTAHEHVIEGEMVRGPTRQSLVVRREPAEGIPAENAPRVWDLCKPYLLPAVVFVGVGASVAFGVLAALRWYTSEYSGPSQQQRFEALWGAHRRGDDIAAPEVPKVPEEADPPDRTKGSGPKQAEGERRASAR